MKSKKHFSSIILEITIKSWVGKVFLRGGIEMNYLYILYALLLATLAIFTGEIVTFIVLGFVLLALNNILAVLKETSRKLDRTDR